jgi:hypothetical protein
MWSAIVVAVMAALTGFYMLPAERSRMVVENLQAREQAESMGVYRQAVVAYFSAHDVSDTSVDIYTLKQSGVVPAWSTLHTRPSNWANYRDHAGVIYIFPSTLASANIVGEVLKLSRYSMNVGVYRASDHTLYSPLDGTRIALAPLGATAIPDTAPVWMASRAAGQP